ncbi:MAG: response regulator [Blastocatellia bacterium]|nr:response regulator [Blastocatellia bacterium]
MRILTSRFWLILLGWWMMCGAAPVWALDPAKAVTQYVHDVWQDGLPQNTVTAITQTRDGYLWLGTYEGLVRFDGVRFTVFSNSNTKGLQGKSVLSLLEDRSGRLWIAMLDGGLGCFSNGVFRTYTTQDGLPHNFIGYLYEDRHGTVWVATVNKGVCAFRDGKFDSHPFKTPLPSLRVYSMFEDSRGVLWVGTSNGLFALRDGNLTAYSTKDGLPHDNINALFEDSAGQLWIGTFGGGLCSYRDGVFTNHPIAAGQLGTLIWTIREDKDRNLWIGTENGGLYRFRDGVFSAYSVKDGLSSDTVRAIYEDREGSLWAGTNGGLNRFRDGKFTSLTTKEGLSFDYARTICEDSRGRLWIGVDSGGLNCLQNGKFTTYTTKDGLSNNSVKTLCEDHEGNLWVGVTGGDLCRFKDGTFTTFGAKDGFTGNNMRALCTDRSGTVWIGTVSSGLFTYRNGTFTHFTGKDGLPHESVRALYEDREGRIWVGTYGGISVWQDGKFLRNYGMKDGLANDSAFTFYEDSDRTLWIGTNGGLCRFRNGKFTCYTTKDGLFDDLAFQILEDNRNNLWMSCNRGIYFINRADVENYDRKAIPTIPCTVFGKGDGMGTNQCNGNSQPAGWKTRDGRLWFPTTAGVTVVDPERITTNQQVPEVWLEKVVADTESFLPAERTVFGPGSPKFEFHYTALSFLAPEKVRFRFKLTGLDQDWSEDVTRRVAYFTNLAPGDYTFQVIACNNDGVWNRVGAVYRFRLKPPLWRTWWAYLLYVVTGGGCIYGGVRWRLRTLRKQTRVLEQNVRERTAELANTVAQLQESEQKALELADKAQAANLAKSVFLSSMSHELRTPLNAVLGFAQLMERDAALSRDNRDNLSLILRSGEHLLQLINDVLSISKIEAGKITLSPQPFDVRWLLKGIEEMIRVRAAGKNLTLIVDLAPEVPRYVQGDEGKFRQVLINLLGNAVKFTSQGGIALRAKWVEGIAEFEVEDTGFGIAAEELETLFEPFVQTQSGRQSTEGTGLGLALSQNFIRLMGGEITVRSQLGKGTVFHIRVPLPAAEAPVAEPGSLPQVVRLASDQPPVRLLVVDDNASNRLLLNRLLSSIGCEVREAANGQEAVDLWQTWHPHLIWMDMRMPVMDGYDATRRIRELEKQGSGSRVQGPGLQNTAESPVLKSFQAETGSAGKTGTLNPEPWTLDPVKIIALTASAFEHDRAAILANGCDDYVTKPFRNEEIFSTLEKHLHVRFLTAQPETQPANTDDFSLIPASRLAALPEPLVAELEQAMNLGDGDWVTRLVGQITELDAPLGLALAQRTRRFQFDEILDVIESLPKSGRK